MTQPTLHPIAARFASTDLMVDPSKKPQIEAALMALARSDEVVRADAWCAAADASGFWPEAGHWMNAYRPYTVVDGVLQIPVKGVLLHDFTYCFGWATGYDYIWQAFKRGMEDGGVRGIALVIDSGGGEVAGNFDLVDKMFALRGEKPVRAFAAEHAYSAAYSIASVADRVIVSRTGGVGSIGVVTTHSDWSKFWSDVGIQFTFIFAGKHKVDGNPYESLPEDVKARIQSRIDALYSVFVATVARNRSMDEKAVRATEALTFMASDAVSNGLADEIGSLEDALAEFMADLNEGEDQMSDKQDKPTMFDQAALDAARAEGMAAGRTEGITAERQRLQGILALDSAKQRRVQAINFAVKTDLSVEAVDGLLTEAPVEAEAKAEKPAGADFDKAMQTGNPQVGAPEGATESDPDAAKVVSIMSSYRNATGRKA